MGIACGGAGRELLRLAVLGLAGLSLAAGMPLTAVAAASSDCLDNLRPALLAGGFSGATDCGAADIEIKHIGNTSGLRQYDVYSYAYQRVGDAGTTAQNGTQQSGQSILIFEQGKYLGRYALQPSPGSIAPSPTLSINGSDVLLGLLPTSGTILRLDSDPPITAFLDDNVVQFGK